MLDNNSLYVPKMIKEYDGNKKFLISYKSGYIPFFNLFSFSLNNTETSYIKNKFINHDPSKNATTAYPVLDSFIKKHHGKSYSFIRSLFFGSAYKNGAKSDYKAQNHKESIKASIQAWINFVPKVKSFPQPYITTVYSEAQINNFKDVYEYLYIDKGSNRLCGSGLFGVWNNKTVTPLQGNLSLCGCLMVKQENFKLLKYMIALNEPIDFNKYLEFWIEHDLDSPLFFNQGARRFYRKFIKPYIESYNIPIIEKVNLNNWIEAKIPSPIIKSITDKQKFTEASLSEFLNWKRKEFGIKEELPVQKIEYKKVALEDKQVEFV